MRFSAIQLAREGVIHCKASIKEVFPLLCPKKEEEWIPGWECETIWSRSGYNEEGAVFRTQKPYGTELYWTTLQYDIEKKVVDFLLTAPRLFLFRYTIQIQENGDGCLDISLRQIFTSVSEEGNVFIQGFQREDHAQRLRNIETNMSRYLVRKRGGS